MGFQLIDSSIPIPIVHKLLGAAIPFGVHDATAKCIIWNIDIEPIFVVSFARFAVITVTNGIIRRVIRINQLRRWFGQALAIEALQRFSCYVGAAEF